MCSMRFPECFVAADEARKLQRTIEKEIARYLGKRLQRISDQPKVWKYASQTTTITQALVCVCVFVYIEVDTKHSTQAS